MDQTGQKQKAKRENRVKPWPNDGERPEDFPLHRDLFGVSDPRYVSQAEARLRRRSAPSGRAPLE